MQVYEEGLQSVSSARMYELYADFLINNLEHDDEQIEADQSSDGSQNLEKSAETLLTLYERAKVAGVESEALAQGQAGLLLRWGNVGSAIESLENSCKETASTCGSSRIWMQLFSIETKLSSVKNLQGSEQHMKLLKASLKMANDDVKILLQMVSILVFIPATPHGLDGQGNCRKWIGAVHVSASFSKLHMNLYVRPVTSTQSLRFIFMN